MGVEVCFKDAESLGKVYGKEEHGWKCKEARVPFWVGFWKETLKESEWFFENWKFRIEDGSKIKFWIDHWCGPRPSALSISFPVLFELVVNQFETVAEAWDQCTG